MTRILPHDHDHRFATRSVHAGQILEPLAGAVMTPIYQTSTYVQPALGRHKGYEYARTQNPTREALERNVASLEGAVHGFAFGSGLAALDAVLKLLRSGDHVVCGDNVYGGTHRLMERVYTEFGVRFTFVDMRETRECRARGYRRDSNDLLRDPHQPDDESGGSGRGRRSRRRPAGYLYVVDNTFATPFFQRPIESGADIVLHSTTKYLNGHSDMVGGILVTSRDDLAERLGFIQNAAGGVPGPMDCWLALRGIKTLPLRMRQHDANGRAVAAWLTRRPEIRRVYYPGLPTHPQHDLACRQMTGFGGMISFDLGDPALAKRFVERTRIFALAESLGGVESLVGHPATMTHASVPPQMRQAMGLTDSLVRLSCGVEDADDLLADLDQALAATR